MVVSALVVMLSAEPAHRARALDALAADPRLTLGELVRDRLPVVAESASASAGVTLCDQLAAREGVVRVDVVSIDFEVEAREVDA
jgi:hypothetical protein